jgi:cysteine-rich repeat protein
MIVGSSGACLETCGDGKSFGMNMCDDGNRNNGDGCSSNCVTEKDNICSGGYPYSKDSCSYIPTEIVGVTVNEHNDLIVKFSRPIQLRNGILSSKDLEITYRNELEGLSVI